MFRRSFRLRPRDGESRVEIVDVVEIGGRIGDADDAAGNLDRKGTGAAGAESIPGIRRHVEFRVRLDGRKQNKITMVKDQLGELGSGLKGNDISTCNDFCMISTYVHFVLPLPLRTLRLYPQSLTVNCARLTHVPVTSSVIVR